MARARGRARARCAPRCWTACTARGSLLLVGAGNNGGDALYAGALLARRGARVEALLLADRVHEAGLLGAAARPAAGVVQDLGAVREPADVDLVVDGLLGIGGRGGLRGRQADVVARLPDGRAGGGRRRPQRGGRVDTGEVARRAVRADLTVTFGALKTGLLVDPGRRARRCGRAGRHRARRCHRPESSCCRRPTWRRCCRGPRGSRTSTAAACSVSRRLRASTPAPRCCARAAPCTAEPAWCATWVPTRLPTWCGPGGPRSWSARAGCRPGRSGPVAGRTPRDGCSGRRPTAYRCVVDADALDAFREHRDPAVRRSC